MTLAADKAAALALSPVSHETEARLDRFVELLQQWQAKTNLVAPSTLSAIWTRHIADSLQLLSLAPGIRRWADLGSGGGFPGIVLACAMANRPGAAVHLVERNGKKAAFLREALRVTGGAGAVYAIDIGDYVDSVGDPPECVTARALAPLNVLLSLSAPLLQAGVKALFLKGQDIESELTEATKCWKIEHVLHPSRTGAGWVVEIDGVEAVGYDAALQHGGRR